MKNPLLISALLMMSMLFGCARDEQRAPRYDQHQCQFCIHKPGECSYCFGSKKCPFCQAGTRKTVVPADVDPGVKYAEYKEKCQYCQGTAICPYCEGIGKCWVCDGSGKINDWDFYKKFKTKHPDAYSIPTDSVAVIDTTEKKKK